MRRERGLSVTEILIIVICVGAAFVFLRFWAWDSRPPRGGYRRGLRCQSNLSQIAKAMNMYLVKYGDNSMYAIPAQSFRGDCWLATLYWTEIIREPRVFLCPDSGDAGRIPSTRPSDLTAAWAVPRGTISYAGLCRGLRGKHAHRNTRSFSEAAISNACVLACDDNEGTQNHVDGMNIVYFDSHVEFRAGRKVDTYDLIGAKGGPYEYLDSGEE